MGARYGTQTVFDEDVITASKAIDDFYTARGGEFETFTFDLSHINESGTVRVRFDGKLDITHVASRGSNLVDNFYVVKLSLQEDYN